MHQGLGQGSTALDRKRICANPSSNPNTDTLGQTLNVEVVELKMVHRIIGSNVRHWNIRKGGE